MYGKVLSVDFRVASESRSFRAQDDSKDDPGYGHQYNNRNWDGLLITVEDNEPIRIFLSNSQSCCESWRIDLNGSFRNDTWLAKFQEDTITELKWNHKRGSKLTDRNRDINAACVQMRGESGALYYVDVFCFQNGYYPHTLLVEWQDYYHKSSL